MTLLDPPDWSDDELEANRRIAIELFRQQRMEEPLEDYLSHFDEARSAVEDLLELTVDLSEIRSCAVDIMTSERFPLVVRYLAGPPISEDDLKVVADSALSRKVMRDSEAAERVVDTVLLGLDRSRFPWVGESREPTEAERQAAVTATAASIASRKVMTSRANEAKEEQEEAVKAALRGAGFTEEPTRPIPTMHDAPGPGAFCGESMFGSRKADIIVRLWDHRVMPLECKVSNSSTNSVKRLNNDAAVKGRIWTQEFGTTQVVPSAMLGGVYKRHNLRQAQDGGLTLWWAHDLPALLDWIERTRP